ncbi:hypothetical protein IP92_00146 [Pseudoduganella flava]|uniref:Uncharacterized protein n=1 Tax=Pseudoduganella flava TaxID=871742 RepID=A0A562Q393_9BURK|nr:hypothetical protein [Pseudoduganella flava]QGZ41229.1 hypothetical protein GO485_20640 [Pseudoduganella flava]TWI51163.1 hypothetical protein IP92_00146 [Pseudoduganella flava]
MNATNENGYAVNKLERKWWFAGLAGALTTLVCLYLMEGAGLPRIGQMNGYQFVLYCFAFAGLWRAISFGMWLVALMLRVPAAQRQ